MERTCTWTTTEWFHSQKITVNSNFVCDLPRSGSVTGIQILYTPAKLRHHSALNSDLLRCVIIDGPLNLFSCDILEDTYSTYYFFTCTKYTAARNYQLDEILKHCKHTFILGGWVGLTLHFNQNYTDNMHKMSLV